MSGTELYRFFGHVARAMARREGSFGLRMLAFDPFVGELIMPEYDVVCATLLEVLQQSDFVSMHAPGEAGDAEYAERNTFSANEEAGDLHQYRPRPYRRRGSAY